MAVDLTEAPETGQGQYGVVYDPNAEQKPVPSGYKPFRTTTRDPQTGQVRVTAGFAPDAGPPTAVQQPGAGTDMTAGLQAAFASYPVDEAIKAVRAADQYMAQRELSSRMAKGIPFEKAAADLLPRLVPNGAGMTSMMNRNAPPTQQQQIQNQFVRQRLAMEQQKMNQPPKPPVGLEYKQAMDKELSLADAARKSGNEEEAQKHQDNADQIKEMMPSHPQMTMEITGYDDQGRPLQRATVGSRAGMSASGSGSTIATESQAQQKDIQFENLMELGDSLKNLSPKSVGVSGIVKQTLGQYAPQLLGGQAGFDPKVIDDRVKIGMYRESAMRLIGDNPRFTLQDRKEISGLLPNLGPGESLPDAAARINKVKDIIKDRTRVYSERTGTPLPYGAMSEKELAESFNKKIKGFRAAIKRKTIPEEKGNAAIAALQAQANQQHEKWFPEAYGTEPEAQ